MKHRARIPFLSTFKESARKAKSEGKTPVVVLVEKRSTTPLVICRLADLKRIADELPDDTTVSENESQ